MSYSPWCVSSFPFLSNGLRSSGEKNFSPACFALGQMDHLCFPSVRKYVNGGKKRHKDIIQIYNDVRVKANLPERIKSCIRVSVHAKVRIRNYTVGYGSVHTSVHTNIHTNVQTNVHTKEHSYVHALVPKIHTNNIHALRYAWAPRGDKTRKLRKNR